MSFAMTPVYWLVVFVALLVIELLTMGLTTIWFAGGALAAMVVCICKCNIFMQLCIFVIVSLFFLIFTRPFAMKYVNNKHTRTNVDELIGTEGFVLEEVNNLKETGKVQLRGMEWTARSVDMHKTIAKDQVVEVCSIEGVKLIVKEKGDFLR